jgi:hypothetical protein
MLRQMLQNSRFIKNEGFKRVLVIGSPLSKVDINATSCVN